MLTLELTIRSQARPTLPMHAQFVVGESPRVWIDEIVSWGANDHELRLVVIPRSRADLKPIGVLVFNRDGTPLLIDHAFLSTKTISYGLIGSQVYLPCDAAIEPAISVGELSQQLIPERTYAWHPTAGLVGVAPDDLLSVSHLFSTPKQTSVAWNEAHCGTAWAKQLVSVALAPDASPTVNDALQSGMDNIGSQASDIQSLDPILDPDGRTGEPGNSPIDKARNSMARGFAKLVRGLTNMVPGDATDPTWINKLEDWAGGKLQKLNEQMEQQRFKELFRLQKLLEQNPDEGLQYALPLNSTGANRGTAAPSSHLSQNRTDFSLSGLRSGGPADYWDIPDDLRTRLNRQYRELAEREINLGRYRRAAYIYGKLLGDLSAAARTLEAGKHYREAAIIYRKKLNRNADAARCLEKAGLWSEVIALREELQQFEMAGDVYLQLGLEDQAILAFKQAVSQKLAQQNFTGAARIEEDKLNDLEAALEVLEQGWPASNQSNLCIQEIFRLLGSNGRHDESNAWIARIENEISGATSKAKLLQTLTGFANNYPNQTTRELAHESTFRIVSAELVDDPFVARSFLNSIADLHPEDKLLVRDCSRFRPTSVSSQTTAGSSNDDSVADLITSFQLPKQLNWVDGIALGDGYLVIGQKNQHVTMLKLSGNFKEIGEQTTRLSNPAKATFALAKTIDNQRVVVHCPLDERFGNKEFFATDDSPQKTFISKRGVDSGTLGIAAGPNEQWIVTRISSDGQLLVEILNASGGLVSSKPLEIEMLELVIPVPIYNDGSNTYLGIGHKLVTMSAAGDFATTEFDDPIKSIQGSVRGMLPRIALSFERSVQIIWSDSEIDWPQSISSDYPEPQILFTRTGHLVVAAGDRCEIYKTSNHKVKLVKRIDIEPCRRLIRHQYSSHFATLTKSGKICVYRIPMA